MADDKGTVNKVILIGNLGADPEMRTIPDGTSLVNLRIATTQSWADKNNPQGQRIEKTEWHRVSFFGRQAEVINDYFRKGSKIYIEGALTTRKWQDKDGNDRYSTDVRGLTFAFLERRGGGEGGGQSSSSSRPAQTSNSADEGFGDMEDIPF